LPVIVLFTNIILISISTIIVSLGRLYNLIDKWLVDFPKGHQPQCDGVIDYIQLFNSLYNVPDIFITIGTILLFKYILFDKNE